MMTSWRAPTASSYVISGSGFAIAKMMGSFAMLRTISFVTTPFTETPANTSAPFMASARVWPAMKALAR